MAEVPEQDATSGGQSGGRYPQRNFADRLFPGPSRQRSRQFAEHVEGLLRAPNGVPGTRQGGVRAADPTSGGRDAVGTRRPSAPESAPAVTPEDLAQVKETLDQQNELLRAILASTADTQTDARSTAQNSRTFAWAGTAIAFLTLVATVISIIAVVQAR